jgi:hypothetical protein
VPSHRHADGEYDVCDPSDGLPLGMTALLRRRHIQKCHGYEVTSFTSERIHGNSSDPDALLNSILAPHGGVDGVRLLS